MSTEMVASRRDRKPTARTILASLFTLAALAISSRAQAMPIEDCISEREFTALAEKASHKVNLFERMWRADPKAEFYGGTSRDYLYWLLRQFRGATSREECLKILRRVEEMPLIDVREFMHGDSDVDVISTRESLPVSADDFGVRKIDTLSPNILDKKTAEGFNEFNQGYIPAEKIRITAAGIKTLEGQEDGLHELYSGKLTVRFAPEDVFWKTAYALARENHPILLALRYIRILAQDYYQRHGTEYETDILLDPAIDREIRTIIESVQDGKSLKPFLEQSRFASWLNGSIAKSFRSSANPTAARWLLHHFEINSLVGLYPEIKPFNTYLFHKRRDEERIRKNFRKFKLAPEDAYLDVSRAIPDRKLFHGTPTEEGFKSILLEGIIPSDSGSAGAGVYGVSEKNVAFAIDWGDSKDRVVALTLAPETKFVDITRGAGAKLWKDFKKRFPEADEELFCEAFGIDLLRYPYTTTAFVLKNSAIVTGARGYTRNPKVLSEILIEAKTVSDLKAFSALAKEFMLFPRTSAEIRAFMEAFPHMDRLVEEISEMKEDARGRWLMAIGPIRTTFFEASDALKADFQKHLKSLFSEAKSREKFNALVNRLTEQKTLLDLGPDDTREILKQPIFSKLARMRSSYHLDWVEFMELFSDLESIIILAEHRRPVDGAAYSEQSLYEILGRKLRISGIDSKTARAIARHVVHKGTYHHRGAYFHHQGAYFVDELYSLEGLEHLGEALRAECLALKSCAKYLENMTVGIAKGLLVEQLLDHEDFAIDELDQLISKNLLPLTKHIENDDFSVHDASDFFSRIAGREKSMRLKSMREIFKRLVSEYYGGANVSAHLFRISFLASDSSLDAIPKHWWDSDAGAESVENLLKAAKGERPIENFFAISQRFFPQGFAKTKAFKRGMDLIAGRTKKALREMKSNPEFKYSAFLEHYSLFVLDKYVLLDDPNPAWYRDILEWAARNPELRHNQFGDAYLDVASELQHVGKRNEYGFFVATENPTEIYLKFLALARIAPTSPEAMTEALLEMFKYPHAIASAEFAQAAEFFIQNGARAGDKNLAAFKKRAAKRGAVEVADRLERLVASSVWRCPRLLHGRGDHGAGAVR